MDPTTLFAREPLPGVKVSETPPAPSPPAPSPQTSAAAAPAVPYPGQLPAWVTAELPPQYAELANKIAAIHAEARKYEDIAGVVWQTGRPLIAAVGNLFAAMRCDPEVTDGGSYDVTGGREAIQRKSPQIAQIVRALQEDAGTQDRVVLAGNVFCETPVPSRQDPVAPDALRIIQGLGANFVATSTLLGLWKYSLTDMVSAKKSVMRLHAQDGGIFR